MYQKDVIILYKELAKKWNCNYKLEFNNRKSQCGLCDYNRETISISIPYIKNNLDRLVKNTILHEIAHALTKSGHDKKWKLKCIEIGCNPNRINNEAIIPAKYIGICPKCGNISVRHRRIRVACGPCCRKHNNGKFTEKYLLKYKLNSYN